MDSEQTFWINVWRIIAASFVAVFLIGTVSCQVTNYRIGRAIADGASPMEARCALEGDFAPNCILVMESAP